MRALILSLLLTLAVAAVEPEYPSPGGAYVLRLVREEVRMSHWVDQPLVVRSADQARMWSARYPWSASAHEWLSPDTLSLEMRRYPGDRPAVRMVLNFRALTYRLGSEPEQPLEELERFLR